MYTTAPPPTAGREKAPDSVAFQAIPIYHSPKPAPEPAPKPIAGLFAIYALVLVAGAGAIALVMYNAGIAAGQQGSAAKVAALESQAAVTDERVKNFCEAF